MPCRVSSSYGAGAGRARSWAARSWWQQGAASTQRASQRTARASASSVAVSQACSASTRSGAGSTTASAMVPATKLTRSAQPEPLRRARCCAAAGPRGRRRRPARRRAPARSGSGTRRRSGRRCRSPGRPPAAGRCRSSGRVAARARRNASTCRRLAARAADRRRRSGRPGRAGSPWPGRARPARPPAGLAAARCTCASPDLVTRSWSGRRRRSRRASCRTARRAARRRPRRPPRRAATLRVYGRAPSEVAICSRGPGLEGHRAQLGADHRGALPPAAAGGDRPGQSGVEQQRPDLGEGGVQRFRHPPSWPVRRDHLGSGGQGSGAARWGQGGAVGPGWRGGREARGGTRRRGEGARVRGGAVAVRSGVAGSMRRELCYAKVVVGTTSM